LVAKSDVLKVEKLAEKMVGDLVENSVATLAKEMDVMKVAKLVDV
jgi:hypothetical protein